MKKLLLILFVSIVTISAQNYKFAWLTDTHIGYPDADAELDSVVALINSLDDIKFVIASGDITEKGTNEELESAFGILEKLKVDYYIVPGNHDTKWSESGTTKFTELWGDDRFSFKHDNTIYIGLNTGIPWRGGGGHFAPEDLRWLEEELEAYPGHNIVLVIHHPLDKDIDNWFKAVNILREYNVQAVLFGHGHTNKLTKFNGIPAAMSRAAISKNQKSYGFTVVETTRDSLYFHEVESDTTLQLWGKMKKRMTNAIPHVDTAEFEALNAEVLWQYDLNYTMSAQPLVYEGRIYTADFSGLVTCLDTLGNVIWEYGAFGNVLSKPAAKDGMLAVSTVQGDLVTLNAYTGEQLQTIGFDDYLTSQLTVIDYTGNKRLMVPKKTESKAAVIAGTASGKLFCYDLETLEQIWVNEDAQGMIETEPLHYDFKLIYGSWDTNLYCINDKTGILIWKWSNTDSFYYSPAACKPVTNGESVFVAAPDKHVYAIDMLLGKTEWTTEKFNAWESIGISGQGHRIYVKSSEDEFHIASARTNNWVKQMNLKFGLDTMPVTPIEVDRKVYFGTKSGYVYEIDENFNARKLLFLGSARVHTIQHIKENIFAASNMDGRIVLFKTK